MTCDVRLQRLGRELSVSHKLKSTEQHSKWLHANGYFAPACLQILVVLLATSASYTDSEVVEYRGRYSYSYYSYCTY